MTWQPRNYTQDEFVDLSTSRIATSENKENYDENSIVEDLKVFDSLTSNTDLDSERKKQGRVSNYETGDTMPVTKVLPIEVSPREEISIISRENEAQNFERTQKIGAKPPKPTSQANNSYTQGQTSTFGQNPNFQRTRGYNQASSFSRNSTSSFMSSSRLGMSYSRASQRQRVGNYDNLRENDFEMDDMNKEREINRIMMKISRRSLDLIAEIKNKLNKFKRGTIIPGAMKMATNREDQAAKDIIAFKQSLRDRFDLLI